MRVEHSEVIAAPVKAVWDLTLDVESWPSFTPTMTSVELVDDSRLELGSLVRIKQPGQPERTWTVECLDTNRRFAWTTRAWGMTMTGSHDLRACEEGTRNTLAVDLDGALAVVLSPLLRRPLRRALAAENAGFKSAAEGATYAPFNSNDRERTH